MATLEGQKMGEKVRLDQVDEEDHEKSSLKTQISAWDNTEEFNFMDSWIETISDADGEQNDPLVNNSAPIDIKDVAKGRALRLLPAKSLIRFRSLSKERNLSILDPFAEKQSSPLWNISGFFCQCSIGRPIFISLSDPAYSLPYPSVEFLPESVEIKSSCNGLLLCQGWDGDNLHYICNPVNGEWRVLPQLGLPNAFDLPVVLAFEPSEGNEEAEYRVVCAITLLYHNQNFVHFDIYSSKTYSWRRSHEVCFELEDSSLNSYGFYMKGIAFWLSSTNKILAFDLNNDLSNVCQLPSQISSCGVLAQLHEEVCYICPRDPHENTYVIDIYGGMSFNPLMTVNFNVGGILAEECRVVALLNSDIVMFVIGRVMYSYQLSNERLEVVSSGEIGAHMRCIPHVNSLFCLNDGDPD